MKTARHVGASACAAALVALAAWVTTTSPAQADHSWSRLGLTDFPAYVRAIKFSSGNVMDAQNWLSWGSWKVSFGSERPRAEWNRISPPPPPGDISFTVKGLQCENPVVGRVGCWIWIHIVYGEHQCTVVIDGNSPDIRIRCPQHVVLE